MSLEEAKLLLMKEASNDDVDLFQTNKNNLINTKYKEEVEKFLISIYEYWKTKRNRCVI